MHPTLFTIPGINYPIPSYGVMMMFGFLAGIILATRRATKSGANPDVVLNCGFIALFGGIAGARAMYVIHYWSEKFANRASVGETLFAIINVTEGGLEFYGGFLGAVLGTIVYLALWKHSLRWYLDIMAPSAMVGLAFGRLGCFLNGCCWGGVCDLPWAVEFPYGSPPHISQWHNLDPNVSVPGELVYTMSSGHTMLFNRDHLRATPEQIAAAEQAEAEAQARVADLTAQVQTGEGDAAALKRELEVAERDARIAAMRYGDIRAQMEKYGLTFEQLREMWRHEHSRAVHPAQLYAALAAALLALLLDRLYWVRRRDGQVLLLLLAIQPPTRFILEIIRTDNPRDTFAMTISQALALGMTVVAIIGLFLLRKMPPRSPRAQVWEPPPEIKKQGGKAGRKAPAGA